MGACASKTSTTSPPASLSRQTSACASETSARGVIRQESIDGARPPRHRRARDGSTNADAEARRIVRAIEREAGELRSRQTAERLAHAVMLAEERRARDAATQTSREERRRRGMGGDAEGYGRCERMATHTTNGAVLDRRYVAGLTETTANQTRVPRRTHPASASPTIADEHGEEGGTGDAMSTAMSRASLGSLFATSAQDVDPSTRSETSVHGKDASVRSGHEHATPAGRKGFGEDQEVPTRTTPFSDRVEKQLQASAIKGKRPEDATP
ncbi:unnamed product [Ostreococcus tauri]|uniref:Unnamed product n=1 Tax=Ostreococcus tauri TaxID=70448 RepID=Q015V2_OSTTA|nr:unnamed product [Ostreococcus tauri]CAL54327.1 unnamed product [Ostreococcus tauri]|eukprot:XP_003080160.1 unnamed product [Ostreococcus tauri]